MDKSAIEKFINNLKSAGIEEYALRFEGGNKTMYQNENAKISLLGDYIVSITTKNNYGAAPKACFTVEAVPYETIDNAKSFDMTAKELLAYISAEGITLDDDLKAFISSHGGRVSMGQRTEGGYYAEIHNEKGQVVFPTPIPARVTTATITEEEGTTEIDPESPVK
jgi:hypothetical protein